VGLELLTLYWQCNIHEYTKGYAGSHTIINTYILSFKEIELA